MRLPILNKLSNRNIMAAILGTVIIWFMILVLGPMDVFTHGFFCDVVDVENIDSEDFLGNIDLGNGRYEGKFTPTQRHFRGFEISLTNLSEESTGTLVVSVLDKKNKIIGKADVDISQMTEEDWFRVYIDANLKVGTTYYYRIEAVDCEIAPYLRLVDKDYLGEEDDGTGILLGYAYAKSTFSLPEKILLSLFLLGLWLIMIKSLLFHGTKELNILTSTAIFIIMTVILVWNYMYNSFDNQNTQFDGFQVDSEVLVTNVIYAEKDGAPLSRYGLGKYTNALGGYGIQYFDDGSWTYGFPLIHNEDWTYGYSNTEAKIMLSNEEVAKGMSAPGNYIEFSNGEMFQITEQVDTGSDLIISINADRPLNYYKYGELSLAKFYDGNKNIFPAGSFGGYSSQFGLQGKVFRHISRWINDEYTWFYLHFLCSVASAIIFSLIVILVKRKYNILMAGCFYTTFLLSPWVVNFARNLYWVEFTWFIPMLVGLFCAIYINDRKYRVLSYAATVIAVTVKCLCGYEYISTIMLGCIAFLLVDFVKSFFEKDRKQLLLLLRTIIIIGCCALLGFAVAICIHANIRGEGNLFEGIRNIIEGDVLRRTNGGDLNKFPEILWPSFNASIWETCCKYFHFSTEIITGLAGNLFPILCVIPLIIFVSNLKNHILKIDEVALYVVFLLVAISWFVLGKSHSYIHTTMNYVLWYFGYVQTCIYIVCRQFLDIINGKRGR